MRFGYEPVNGGILLKVMSTKKISEIKEVYDIEVGSNSSYLTSSFVVHNSAVGFLSCFLLGITDVDPLKHDLLPERFLSDSRGGRQLILDFDPEDEIV